MSLSLPPSRGKPASIKTYKMSTQVIYELGFKSSLILVQYWSDQAYSPVPPQKPRAMIAMLPSKRKDSQYNFSTVAA